MLAVSDTKPPSGNVQGLAGWLTPRGWALSAIGALLGFVGLVVRINEMLPLSLAAFVLLGGALVWVKTRSWHIEQRRAVTPARVSLGTAALVDLTVINVDRRRSPVLSARDPFGDGRGAARFTLAPIDPGGSVRASYKLSTDKRGVFALGPLEFHLSDPFGLATVQRQWGKPFLVRVHPAIERLAPLNQGDGVSEGSSDSNNALHLRGDEFDGLREYQTGDDLRRVHWASSARHDLLMIRQDHEPEDPRTLLVGDLRHGVHTVESFERTLSVLASLADAGHRGGQSMRVVLTGGADSAWGVGPSHALAMLDLLAGARFERSREISLSRLRWDHAKDCATIIVTTDEVSDNDLAEAPATNRRGEPPLVILVARPGTQQPPLGRPGQRLLVAPLGIPFATAWRSR